MSDLPDPRELVADTAIGNTVALLRLHASGANATDDEMTACCEYIDRMSMRETHELLHLLCLFLCDLRPEKEHRSFDEWLTEVEDFLRHRTG